MNKKIILILGLFGGLIISGYFLLNPFKQKASPSALISTQPSAPITPSKTLKTYSDPSGFSFSYPDNLSLLNNELKDNNSYAELQLASKGIDGSLILKISDSKLASIESWVKLNKTDEGVTKEVNLGRLKALEIKTSDKLLLGALDQGVLFNIEIPLGKDKDFWTNVYNKVLADFSFVPASQESTNSQGDVDSSQDVTFEEEVAIE